MRIRNLAASETDRLPRAARRAEVRSGTQSGSQEEGRYRFGPESELAFDPGAKITVPEGVDSDLERSMSVSTSAGVRVTTAGGHLIHYDSGWRDITSLLWSQWARADHAAGGLFIRRENSVVSLAIRLVVATNPVTLNATANLADNRLLADTIPSPLSWRPGPTMGGSTGRVMRYNNRSFPAVLSWNFFSAPRLFSERTDAPDWSPGEELRGMLTWMTDGPPPASLMGDPA